MSTMNERLLNALQDYCEREFNEPDKIKELGKVINLAYTTTESGKHEVQVDFDTEKLEWQEYIDGKLMRAEKRNSLKEFIDELSNCDFDSITSDILYLAEEMEENENE